MTFRTITADIPRSKYPWVQIRWKNHRGCGNSTSSSLSDSDKKKREIVSLEEQWNLIDMLTYGPWKYDRIGDRENINKGKMNIAGLSGRINGEKL